MEKETGEGGSGKDSRKIGNKGIKKLICQVQGGFDPGVQTEAEWFLRSHDQTFVACLDNKTISY